MVRITCMGGGGRGREVLACRDAGLRTGGGGVAWVVVCREVIVKTHLALLTEGDVAGGPSVKEDWFVRDPRGALV